MENGYTYIPLALDLILCSAPRLTCICRCHQFTSVHHLSPSAFNTVPLLNRQKRRQRNGGTPSLVFNHLHLLHNPRSLPRSPPLFSPPPLLPQPFLLRTGVDRLPRHRLARAPPSRPTFFQVHRPLRPNWSRPRRPPPARPSLCRPLSLHCSNRRSSVIPYLLTTPVVSIWFICEIQLWTLCHVEYLLFFVSYLFNHIFRKE